MAPVVNVISKSAMTCVYQSRITVSAHGGRPGAESPERS
jgi:hypothetical protein